MKNIVRIEEKISPDLKEISYVACFLKEKNSEDRSFVHEQEIFALVRAEFKEGIYVLRHSCLIPEEIEELKKLGRVVEIYEFLRGGFFGFAPTFKVAKQRIRERLENSIKEIKEDIQIVYYFENGPEGI